MSTKILLMFCLFFIQNKFSEKQDLIDDSKLNEYEGLYKIEKYFEQSTITSKDGFLYTKVDDGKTYKLIKQREADTFKSTSKYGTVYIFVRDSTGKINGLILRAKGREILGKKIK